MKQNIQTLVNPEKCKKLIQAYRLHDYYAILEQKALDMIDACMTGMTMSDIKYCIEYTDKEKK